MLGAIETDTSVPGTVRPAAGLSLGPDRTMRIGIPVRLSGTCYDAQGWNEVDYFYVEERFLTFTHWVAVPLEVPLLFRQPANPGMEPAKDLVCLTRP